MPQLLNPDNNLVFRLELLRNRFLDVDTGRPDTENWIPFVLSLAIDGQEHRGIAESFGATLSLFETDRLIEALDHIVEEKASGRKIQAFEFYSSEAYFELDVYDVLEPEIVGVTIWFNLGALTNGQQYGYDQGYRFNAQVSDLEGFARNLRQQRQGILA